MQSLTLPSFAKINWTLQILGKRADGYHELRTLLQTVDVADELTFELIEQGIELRCAHPLFPLDETNLIYRAAQLMSVARDAQPNVKKLGVRVTVQKNLPMAAGLGGGSSNAAMTLLALQHLWQVRLTPAELFRMGAQLGADVPYFLLGGTCLGVGRGDEVYPTTEIDAPFLLLVNAGLQVPTREAYGNLQKYQNWLTSKAEANNIPVSLQAAYRAFAPNDAALCLVNDLEMSVFPNYSLLAELKQSLQTAGAQSALMSGSGSTVFGLFDSAATRAVALQQFQQAGWWCAPVSTLSRKAYRAKLAPVFSDVALSC